MVHALAGALLQLMVSLLNGSHHLFPTTSKLLVAALTLLVEVSELIMNIAPLVVSGLIVVMLAVPVFPMMSMVTSLAPVIVALSPVVAVPVVMITSVPIVDDRDELLTDREVECLELLVSGESTANISQEMGIKTTTVNTYKQRLKEKLGVDSMAGLIAWGCKHLT